MGLVLLDPTMMCNTGLVHVVGVGSAVIAEPNAVVLHLRKNSNGHVPFGSMGVSRNGGTPKWMVSKRKSH